MNKSKLFTLFVLFIGVMLGYFMTARPTCPDIQEYDDFAYDGDFVAQYYLENKDKYCYSYWVPHGGLWQEMCFDTAAQCQAELAADWHKTNTETCYIPSIVPAWCVGDIQTGEYRTDDVVGEEYQLLATICVQDKNTCEQMRRYQSPYSKFECVGRMVFQHESETSYLTPDYELESIIKNNENSPR